MAHGVLLRHARAVGATDQVDLRRAQRLAHAVQVAHGVGGGVEAGIGLQRGGAVARKGGRRSLAEVIRIAVGVAAFRVLAGERIRLAGAALVDQHDVARLAHLAERPVDGRPDLHGRLARAAGKEEHGIVRRRPFVGRGQPGDVQRHLAAFGSGRILGHLVGRALRLDVGGQVGRRQRAGREGELAVMADGLLVGPRGGAVAAGERQGAQGGRECSTKLVFHASVPFELVPACHDGAAGRM